MPPKATGSVEPTKRADGTTVYRARIRLADGTRERVEVPAKYTTDERRKLYAAAVQEREDERGELLARKRERQAAARPATSAATETCSQYRRRLNKHREELGRGSRTDDESTWSAWIADYLGKLPIASVTREHIEAFRDVLDEQIALHKRTEGAEGIGPKRALNVWSCVTTTFKAATSAKRRDLRVRTDNPCTGVLPPEKGESRRKTFIYPSEIAAVAGCLDVALEWREVFAIGSYLYLRPGELHVLTWADVDLDARVVHVSKAYAQRGKTTKEPKTRNGQREVPIPPTLVPLLERMKRNREPVDLVCPLLAGTPESKRAPRLVASLRAAGCTRPRLFDTTATTMGVNFRSLRDSGITWAAIAGVEVVKLQRRAGHDDIDTTVGYVKEAESFSGGIGEPFGPLPAALVEGQVGAGDVLPVSQGRRPRYQSRYAIDPSTNPAESFGPGLGQNPLCDTVTAENGSKMVEAAGVEAEQTAKIAASNVDPRTIDVTRVDVGANCPAFSGPDTAAAEDVSMRNLVASEPPSGPPSTTGSATEPTTSTTVSVTPAEAPESSPAAAPVEAAPWSRTALLTALGRAVGEAAAAGDLEAARVAHEALGRLLSSAAAVPAGVVKLADRRGK